jgi:SAM-dependent methyltransferase
VRAGDAHALPFDDGSFDAVTFGFCLHHIPDPERALAEARRVLRRGGRLAFSVWAAGRDQAIRKRTDRRFRVSPLSGALGSEPRRQPHASTLMPPLQAPGSGRDVLRAGRPAFRRASGPGWRAHAAVEGVRPCPAGGRGRPPPLRPPSRELDRVVDRILASELVVPPRWSAV